MQSPFVTRALYDAALDRVRLAEEREAVAVRIARESEKRATERVAPLMQEARQSITEARAALKEAVAMAKNASDFMFGINAGQSDGMPEATSIRENDRAAARRIRDGERS